MASVRVQIHGKLSLLYLPPKKRVPAHRIAQLLRQTACAGALSVFLFSGAQAQDIATAGGGLPVSGEQIAPTTVASNQNPSHPQPARAEASTAPLSRPFDFGASVNASEAYVSNANGTSGGSNSDFVSTLGFGAFLHEHSRRVIFDANYSFGVDFYARGTNATQIYNNLQALGEVEAIPDYLTISGKAFAAPRVTSNFGIVTAGNRVVSNGYTNSYGFTVGPDLKLRIGQFMNSDSTAVYGSTFFTQPAGNVPVPVIPGLPGPQNINSRGFTQTFSSGEDFERLNWTVVGLFDEIKRRQGLLSEKAGIGTFRYALNHEFSLLATIGYDALSNTRGLSRNLSGLVAMAGFGLTEGEDFSLQIQAGRKYNDMSYSGSLRYNLTPRSSIVGSVNDSVSTPEGQLLDSLTNLTSTPSGALTSSQSLLGDGTPSTLSGFDSLSLGGLSFDQNIARYQTVNLSFLEDFDRNHAALTFFGMRRTILEVLLPPAPPIPPRTTSWGGRLNLSRNISPVLLATLGGSYYVDQELIGGVVGDARTFTLDGQLEYNLSREMQVYFRGDYVDRQSSAALNALSPFTGSLSDYRITIGVSRTL